MSQDITKLRLTIVEGDQGARIEEIDGSVAPIKVGRLSSSHLRFEDSSVSRIHAVIEKGGDGTYHLIDLGSASGTFVNGDKITNKQAIGHGDELQFGNVVVTLEFVTEQPAQQEPAMAFGGESTRITESPSEQEPSSAATPARRRRAGAARGAGRRLVRSAAATTAAASAGAAPGRRLGRAGPGPAGWLG